MGVSIMMTPGPVGRNFGKQINITPGMRSQAAAVFRSYFGEAPLTLTEAQDLSMLETLRAGASIYTTDEENIWAKLHNALREHGSITVTMEY